MSLHAWEIARTSKMAGVVTQMHFDPSTLTTRIRKAAQRMLSTGVLIGGWSSQSKQVAKLVASHFNLPMTQSSRSWLNVEAKLLTASELAAIKEIFEADLAAFQLEPEVPSYYMRDGRGHEYIRDRLNNQREHFAQFARGDNDHLGFIDSAFTAHAAKIVANSSYARSDENQLKRRLAADYLDTDQCIPIPEFN